MGDRPDPPLGLVGYPRVIHETIVVETPTICDTHSLKRSSVLPTDET